MSKWPPDWWQHAVSKTSSIYTWWVIRVVARAGRAVRCLREIALRHLGFTAWVLAILLALYTPMVASLTMRVQADEVVEKIQTSSVTGDVVSVSPSLLSIENARTGSAVEETLIPVDSEVKLEGPKMLVQLVPGDRVRVDYEQTYRDGENGTRVILKTRATRIALLRSATGEGSLRSSDDGALPP